MEGKIASIHLEVNGLEQVKDAINELSEHLQAAQSILDGLGTVKLEVRAATPPDDTPCEERKW